MLLEAARSRLSLWIYKVSCQLQVVSQVGNILEQRIEAEAMNDKQLRFTWYYYLRSLRIWPNIVEEEARSCKLLWAIPIPVTIVRPASRPRKYHYAAWMAVL